ncbi:MAG: acyl-CoA thioesterase [Bacteroidales bacterium]|nr:acyl-CoA thioesterase [Bacteroidales bacterium]
MFSDHHTKFLHKELVQIRFNDVDIAGHVNNAMYFQYLDYARLRYFEQVFDDTIKWRKKGLVLAKIEIEFFESVFLDDKIFVRTKIEKIGNKSIQMRQHIIKGEGENEILISCCTSVLVGYDYENKMSLTIPREWKEKVLEFEKNVLIKSSSD